ncbi:MAG TPA: ABC transporter permease subunit [Streptosporangiaceae bacterium]|nr:ABC transporter permease subunit [Streptosporangiaceae bacterium]
MTTQVAPAAAPGPLGDPGAAAGRRSLTNLRRARDLAGVVPFTSYVLLGLVLPMGAILIGAFRKPVSGSFTLHNLHIASHGIYLHGFATSMELSLIASVVPGILGFLIAYAIFTARRGSVLRRVAITASGVFANFGGVPLAFLFIATLGNTGLATQWLTDIGFNPYNSGFDLYGLGGVALVYMYFQIPIMVLVILPAFEGLRPAWREAAQNMGARSWQYWRYVGVPVLAPSVLGATLLLFGSAFSAYATAEALTSGTIPLTSIQIGSFLNGNVLAGQQDVGFALGLGMVVIIAVVMLVYVCLQRRAARWLR